MENSHRRKPPSAVLTMQVSLPQAGARLSSQCLIAFNRPRSRRTHPRTGFGQAGPTEAVRRLRHGPRADEPEDLQTLRRAASNCSRRATSAPCEVHRRYTEENLGCGTERQDRSRLGVRARGPGSHRQRQLRAGSQLLPVLRGAPRRYADDAPGNNDLRATPSSWTRRPSGSRPTRSGVIIDLGLGHVALGTGIAPSSPRAATRHRSRRPERQRRASKVPTRTGRRTGPPTKAGPRFFRRGWTGFDHRIQLRQLLAAHRGSARAD